MSIVRVDDPKLSLWQSAVTQVARNELEDSSKLSPSAEDVLDHPMVRATGDFVRGRHSRTHHEFTDEELSDSHTLNTHLSGMAFDVADAVAEGREADHDVLSRSWPFSGGDPDFVTKCLAVYAEYLVLHKGKFLYNDWKVQGGDSLDYGVIQWKLPDDAKVAIIGDWGTGMKDAFGLLTDLLAKHNPDAIIHLGDIYYSGTPEECAAHFADRITAAFDQVLGKGKRIPVFTIPGNHDYYALGYGFFPMLQGLNDGLPNAQQEASYFCLRTEDGGWQFLGMDSGYEDANPSNQIDFTYAGPWLQPTEVEWHRDKLESFGGATILLSHHQAFTAHARINGRLSSQSEFPYLNPFLIDAFWPYFRDKVAAWLWGHEHNLVMYEDGLFGLAKGRLEGAGAFEERVGDHPYENKYPEVVRYLDPEKYQLSPNQWGYYGHSYSIIDFSGRAKPTDPVAVQYYTFPSWYRETPTDPQSTLIYSETYERPDPAPQSQVEYGARVHLSIEGGLAYLSTLYSGLEYYPTVGPSPVELKFLSTADQTGALRSGASVYVQTTESAAKAYNLLGPGPRGTHWLYYHKHGNSKEKWTMVKIDTSVDDIIRFGDAVYLVSQSYSPQTMCPTNDDYFTTTKAQPATMFVIRSP